MKLFTISDSFLGFLSPLSCEQAPPPEVEEEPKPGCFKRIFCCAGSGDKKKSDTNKAKGGGGGSGSGKAGVPLQSAGPSGNQNHSRLNSTPSVSASGVVVGQGGGQSQIPPHSTIGLNSRDGGPPAGVNPNSPKGAGLGGFGSQADHQNTQPLQPLRDSNNIVTPPPAKYLLGPLPPEDVGKKVGTRESTPPPMCGCEMLAPDD